jgi:hypothetical protein
MACTSRTLKPNTESSSNRTFLAAVQRERLLKGHDPVRPQQTDYLAAKKLKARSLEETRRKRGDVAANRARASVSALSWAPKQKYAFDPALFFPEKVPPKKSDSNPSAV